MSVLLAAMLTVSDFQRKSILELELEIAATEAGNFYGL